MRWRGETHSCRRRRLPVCLSIERCARKPIGRKTAGGNRLGRNTPSRTMHLRLFCHWAINANHRLGPSALFCVFHCAPATPFWITPSPRNTQFSVLDNCVTSCGLQQSAAPRYCGGENGGKSIRSDQAVEDDAQTVILSMGHQLGPDSGEQYFFLFPPTQPRLRQQ